MCWKMDYIGIPKVQECIQADIRKRLPFLKQPLTNLADLNIVANGNFVFPCAILPSTYLYDRIDIPLTHSTIKSWHREPL